MYVKLEVIGVVQKVMYGCSEVYKSCSALFFSLLNVVHVPNLLINRFLTSPAPVVE